MKNNGKIWILFIVPLMVSFLGCKKDFLEKKPASNLNVPTSLTDIQMLLDNFQELNFSVGLGELSADDYYMDYNSWNSQEAPFYANGYVWAKDIFAGQGEIPDWNQVYKTILTTNVALEQLAKIQKTSANSRTYDEIKAMALFMRSYMFFDLAQVFAATYDKNTANTDMGIPLRTVADINAPTTRATIQATYDQILTDVSTVKDLVTTGYVRNFLNRPSKASAYAFLSRVYLYMRMYNEAGLYADSALSIHSTLIDYNTISTTAKMPFTLINDEMLYPCFLISNNPAFFLFRSQGYSIDAALYQSYNDNDLRKQIYFAKNGSFINKKGGYAGARISENSIATDELYLTRAECFARAGSDIKSLNDLNKLLSKRFKSGTFVPFANLSGSDLLSTILKERRKELVCRALRWNDIRRLNKEGYNITLTRNLNGKVYVLPPNDPRYVLPIPPDVIARTGIQQNNR